MSESPRTVRYSLAAIFLVVLALNLWIFRFFLVTGATAGSVAVILHPAYERLCKVLRGRPSLASALMIALTTVLILLPLIGYAIILGEQAVALFDFVRPHLEPAALARLWNEILPERYPWFTRIQDLVDFSRLETMTPALSRVAGGVNTVARGAVTGVATLIVYLILFLLLLFFLLRDGRELTEEIRAFLPFSPKEANEIVGRAARTIKGVLYSMVIVPLVQGALAVLGFWIFGMDSPFFWGTLVILAAVIPGVGAPTVWLPVAIYLLVSSSWWQALGLTLYGTLIIGVADNIIKPILLRETAQIHPLLAFLAILGGLLSFGPVGFLIGPVILSLLLSIVRIYRMEPTPEPA